MYEEGPGVLFSGGFERVLRSAPQFGVTLALYDVPPPPPRTTAG